MLENAQTVKGETERNRLENVYKKNEVRKDQREHARYPIDLSSRDSSTHRSLHVARNDAQ